MLSSIFKKTLFYYHSWISMNTTLFRIFQGFIIWSSNYEKLSDCVIEDWVSESKMWFEESISSFMNAFCRIDILVESLEQYFLWTGNKITNAWRNIYEINILFIDLTKKDIFVFSNFCLKKCNKLMLMMEKFEMEIFWDSLKN